ncbi:hypothetical protein [Glacieibacterium frigidum]|uniref:hypothetical protein n=1 Tax=Glacieibacterium frigidum TaxID=2593303 RepID=UPI00163DC372|nr:hypothetical protein [Glacieibacterium frigidum]
MARGDPGLFNDKGVRQDFLDHLARGDSVLAACRALRIQPSSAYEARRCIAGFAESWDARRPPVRSRQKAPLRGGRGGWHKVFLDHYRETANVTSAARAAGVAPATAYRQCTIDADFNLAFIHARAEAGDMITGRLLYQCINGFESTVTKNGVTTHINDPRPDLVLKILDLVESGARTQRRGRHGLPARIPAAPRVTIPRCFA